MAITTAKVAAVLVAAALVISVVPAAVFATGQADNAWAWGIVLGVLIAAIIVAVFLSGRRRPPTADTSADAASQEA